MFQSENIVSNGDGSESAERVHVDLTSWDPSQDPTPAEAALLNPAPPIPEEPQPPSPKLRFRWTPLPAPRVPIVYPSPYPHPPITADSRWVLYLDSSEGFAASRGGGSGRTVAADQKRSAAALNIRVKTSTPFRKVMTAYADHKRKKLEDLSFYVLTKKKPKDGEELKPDGSLLDMNLEDARHVKEVARDIPVLVKEIQRN